MPQPRHRTLVALPSHVRGRFDARRARAYVPLMPLALRISPHLSATPTEAAGFHPRGVGTAVPRPARWADLCACSTGVGTTSPPPRPSPGGTEPTATGSW